MKDRGIYKKSKLIYGWGVNDSTYVTEKKAVVDGKYKTVWRCPVYQDWRNILERGFCPKYKIKRPTYRDVTVSEEWKYFSDFREWVLNIQPNKDWENCIPDKDILLVGNKIYSPETVVYITKELNTFITDCCATRGDYMIGVSFDKESGKLSAQCNNPFLRKSARIARYPINCELEAHKAWQAKKHEYACRLADLQQDPRVADALRQRYSPDKDWTKA